MKSDRDIKIFVDAHVVDGPYQGSRTFIEQLYAEMVKLEGIRLYMAAHKTDQLRNAFQNDERIEYIQYQSNNRLGRILLDIPAITRKYAIDYAHFQYITPVQLSCRTIVTTHDVIFRDIPSEFSLPYRKMKNYLYNRSASKADIITTVSEHSKKSIQKHLKIQKEIHVIPNGIQNEFFSNINKTRAIEFVYDQYGIEKFLLCVSRIEPRKNHALMVKTFARLGLAAKGYFLVFVGSPGIRVPELDRELKKLSSKDRQQVLMLEQVDKKELKNLIKAASVFIYPSKGEGFGIPPLEAAAMATPVICSNATAMQEFTFFGEDHIDPHNEIMFANKLSDLLAFPPGEEVLAEGSRSIREKYSWKRSAEKFADLIKEHHLNQTK